MLLTFLFSFFSQSAKIENKLKSARLEISKRAQLQTRLETVFFSLCQENKDFFYTEQVDREPIESLIVVFDQGIDPDPAFSGSVLGRIFLDEEKNLCLAYWPTEKEKKAWRKEILMKHIESFEFEFLGKPVEKKEKIRPITHEYAWRSSWPKSERNFPSMIRLKIVENKMEEPLLFAFLLPSPTPLITYLEKKAS